MQAYEGRATFLPMSGECEFEGSGATAKYCLKCRPVWHTDQTELGKTAYTFTYEVYHQGVLGTNQDTIQVLLH